MSNIVLIIHLVLALALICVVLLQRSEGGGLGIGGGGGGGGGSMSGFLTGRGTASFLTRTTAILAALFMGTSLFLAILAGSEKESRSILDDLPASGTAPAEESPAGEAPVEPSAPSGEAPAPSSEPSAPEEPSVPLE